MNKTDDNDMHIKIQKGSPNGVTDNKGSCRKLAEYINHEDDKRKAEGLSPLPYTDPNGNEISTEEVIQMIDENAKGLSKNDSKFFHIVVAPSKEEIQKMGKNEQEIYIQALDLINPISRAYAQNFHREGIIDEDDLVIFWKPHFTRGSEESFQFHLHAIVSRKSKGVNGKKLKLSPLTTHRKDVEGPIKGGFDRKAFIEAGEKIFDELFSHEREVAKSFEYQNTLAHGTVDEKAAQADRLAKETLGKMKASIAEKAKKQQEEPETGLSSEDYETLAALMEIGDVKKEILDIFHSGKDQASMFVDLAALGVTGTIKETQDGVEGLTIEKGGITVSAEDIFDENELRLLMGDIVRITGKELGVKARQERVRKEAEEREQQYDQGRNL